MKGYYALGNARMRHRFKAVRCDTIACVVRQTSFCSRFRMADFVTGLKPRA